MAVLSARAEVSRCRRPAGRGWWGPLRASGGAPRDGHYVTSSVSSSPRERRCPAASASSSASVKVLSARAEVSRAGGDLPAGDARPLRASGGVPSWSAPWSAPVRSSPRERRCPGGTSPGDPFPGVLSARAEVSRSTRRPQARLPRPLRASGGVPRPAPVTALPDESSPRERRCPVSGVQGAANQGVLSARAEVSRRARPVRTGVFRPLRASGGVPAFFSIEQSHKRSSPRERRCPDGRSHWPGTAEVLSARAEVSRP